MRPLAEVHGLKLSLEAQEPALLETDPVFHSIPDAAARERLISRYDADLSEAEYALGYRWDIVLRGRLETPAESR